jgi:hypothetical protein
MPLGASLGFGLSFLGIGAFFVFCLLFLRIGVFSAKSSSGVVSSRIETFDRLVTSIMNEKKIGRLIPVSHVNCIPFE